MFFVFICLQSEPCDQSTDVSTVKHKPLKQTDSGELGFPDLEIPGTQENQNQNELRYSQVM